jgi:hypothetical protein
VKYAVVSVELESRATFTITGVDLWTSHAVVYGRVFDRTVGANWSAPDEIRFDEVVFELGQLTVETGPPVGGTQYSGIIAVSTLAAPSANARTVTLVYGGAEVTGTIGGGVRP